ncbi:MAG: hypothetical protein A3E82_07285 [Gammaproteobacteria bacterium RIFCSPHIGHO2_12_FULL_38_11]|nr:MAG: hypothetical protein A3E82_07285 [Gammaproteobacteria bacterium RIFCSPHIGHO2_12_FULL_38_11]
MSARNTFNSNHIYFEATQSPDICKQATRCSSWENVKAYHQVRAVYEESINLLALSMLYDTIKNNINEDKNRVLWLQKQLDANKKKQSPSELSARQSNLIENVLFPTHKKMGGTMLSVIEGYFQHAKKLVSPSCDTTPNKKLHFCLQKEATTGHLSAKRNKSLLDKIKKEQKNKKGSAFFLAGNSHIESCYLASKHWRKTKYRQ